ncbi:MAG: efflux transporter outer membrane subunit [Sphingomonas sp.]
MKRHVALIALLSTACTTLEPKLAQPDPAIPASWSAGDGALKQSEAGLPAVTYRDIFRDGRLQTLIGEALVNNRDLMAAASNIQAALEQYHIQRAQQFPQLNATTGLTASGDRGSSGSSSGGGSGGSGSGSGNGNGSSGSGVSANYAAGLSVPSFELDLFGRLRSLTHAQLEQYLATEAGARSTRLTLVANVSDAWLNYATDASILQIAEETLKSARESVRITRVRLEGGVAPRLDLDQAQLILTQAQADVAQQKALLAQDVDALQLLVGAPVPATTLPTSIDDALPHIAELPSGVDSYVLLRRPDVLQAEYQLRAANANIGAARAELFPRISLTGLLGFASGALLKLFSGGAFGWSAGANAGYTIFQAGAGHANVRLTQAQRNAALANYQHAVQTAFRDVSDALARRATMDEQLAAARAQQAAASDNYLLTEARYRAGIDPFLDVLVAQRAYYTAQNSLVQTKATAGHNRVDLYQALGGDALLSTSPLCGVDYVSNGGNVTLVTNCSKTS